jgi:hypothetical protein
MKRKKRLIKGIESLEEQRKVHQEKKERAKEKGNQELAGYYEKELEKFEREISKKEEFLK